jgi:hypothetical protein
MTSPEAASIWHKRDPVADFFANRHWFELGCKHRIQNAVNDRIGIEPRA